MFTITRRGTLLRIFVAEDDWHQSRPLYHAIVVALKDAGFSGASVLKAIEGFGFSRRVHSVRTVDFATNLPVLIEVMEDEAKIRAFLPQLTSMIDEGLVTLEGVDFVRFRHNEAPV